MKKNYPSVKQDLYGAFVLRGLQLAGRGFMGIVIGETWMTIKSFEPLRKMLLDRHSIDSFVHMHGGSVLPSLFCANSAFVVSGAHTGDRKLPFVRLERLGDKNKEDDLTKALTSRRREDGYFIAKPSHFSMIPGSPIVYWLSEKMRNVFRTPRKLGDVAHLAVGLQTSENVRFLRLWWEVSQYRSAYSCTSREEAAASGARWFPYNKGGDFRKWYGNQEYVVNWEDDGREIRAFGAEDGGKVRSRPQNTSTYFSPSVSWSDISSGEAAFRRFPAGFIHDSTGHSGFGDTVLLNQIALLMNSSFTTEVMKVLSPTMHFHIGYVGQLPVASGIQSLSTASTDALITISQTDWDSAETSWNFASNPLVAESRRQD